MHTHDEDDDGDGDGVAQDGGHRGMQPWFIACFFDIGHPCYDQLALVKTRYPLTSNQLGCFQVVANPGLKFN